MAPTTSTATGTLAEPTLFARLIDDAAVFPPAQVALGPAVAAHRRHRGSGYAALVGPLLVPAAAARELVTLVETAPARPALAVPTPVAPLAVGVIARPGTDPQVVTEALAVLGATAAIDVVGVEVGWTPSWRGLDVGGLPLSLEVPRGEALVGAVADIAAVASDSVPVQAKFRTGATPQWPWPDAGELAGFIRAAVDHDLGFKLTGGLHHAVRGEHPGDSGAPDPQHGVLNVVVATRLALNGADAAELVPVLEERDPDELVPYVVRMSAADAAVVRAFFTAYGCCDVTDPVGELAGLGLVEVGA